MADPFDILGIQSAGQPQQPPPTSFPMVAAHPAPDKSGAMTNLSDQDYYKFLQGQKPSPSAQTAPTQSKGSDPFDILGINPNAPSAPTPSAPQPSTGFWPQLAQGVREGISGLAQTPTAMSRAIGEAVGLHPREPFPAPQFAEPQGARETAGRVIGRGLPAAPLMGLGAAAEAPTLAAAIPAAIRTTAASVLPITTGQIGGETLRQAAPAGWEQPFEFAGQMLGGGAGGLVQAGAEAGIRGIGRSASQMGIGPKQTFQGPEGASVKATSQQAQAAQAKLEQAANQSGPSGVQQFQDLLNNAPSASPWHQPGEIVTGSMPTTAQLAPLPGITKLEDTVRATGAGPQFNQRTQEQNAAQIAAIQQQRPVNDPAAAGQFFRQQMDALDAAGQQQIGTAQGAVQQATEGLGGQGTPTAYGQEMRGSVQQTLDPIQKARRALWAAVDPDGTLAVDTTPITQMANKLQDELTKSDTLTTQEAAVLGHALQLQKVTSFAELQKLRSNALNATRKTVGGEPLTTQGERRLGLIKQSIDNAFGQAVDGKAAQEAHAVANGAMTPDQTMMGRLHAEQQSWYAQRNAASGANAGEGSGPNAGMGSAAVPGPRGTVGQTRGGSGNTQGGQGVSSQAQPLTPNYDAGAAARYAAAREATLREKQTYGQGPVAKILARGEEGAPHEVRDADVPAQIFTKRPSEPQAVQEFLHAAGGDRGVALARDYLVSDLRTNGIIRSDGTLDASAFSKWLHRRGETIKLFPGLGDEFASAKAAQETLDSTRAAHDFAVKDYQNGVAKNFLNEEPGRAVQKILGSADRVKLMQQAIQQMRGNSDALESLKGHVVDYILDKLTSSPKASVGNAASPNITDIGALRPDAFKDWIGANKPWLRRLFGGQGMQTLEQVGADLRRQQTRGISTAGSPTVERGIAASQHGAMKQYIPTALALIGEKVAETMGGMIGAHGWTGLAMEAGGAALPILIHTLRQHGINTVNDLVREAMLHPSVAQELMRVNKSRSLSNIAQRRIASAIQAAALGGQAQREAEQQ